MRVALLVHGKMANFRADYTSWINSIGLQHEVDVFYSKNLEEGSDISEFIEYVKPVAWVHEKASYEADIAQHPLMRPEVIPHNYLSMLKIRQRLWEMFEEKRTKEYDICVSTRADAFFVTDMNLEHWVKYDNHVFCAMGSAESDHGGVNDQIAVARPSIMKVYMGLYDNVRSLLERGVSLHGETLLQKHFEYAKIHMARFQFMWALGRPVKEPLRFNYLQGLLEIVSPYRFYRTKEFLN